MRKEHELWIDGIMGASTCIRVYEYEDGVFTAWGEVERLTPHQMEKALKKEWPEIEFNFFNTGDRETLGMKGRKDDV